MAKKINKPQGESVESREESLVDAILHATTKKFKGLDEGRKLSNDEMATVTGWVSTGSTGLDLAISNRKDGGFPLGKIVELRGREQSGKSLLAAYAVKSTQEQGGVAIIFDTEFAMSKSYMLAIGVDPEKCLVYNLEKIEDIFQNVEEVILSLTKRNKKVPVTIIVDSISGATTEAESASDFHKDGWATDKAIILGKVMRKLTNLIGKQQILLLLTNQVRTKLGTTFGDTETTSGGLAVGFHASVIISLKKVGLHQGKIGNEDTPVGIKTKATIKKNRLGPPLRSVTFDIFFDRGIDDMVWWYDFLKQNNVITTNGAWSSWNFSQDSNGAFLNEKKFYAREFKGIIEVNVGLADYLKDVIADFYIMKYNSSDKMELETLLDDSDI